jgi:hypothetical protein
MATSHISFLRISSEELFSSTFLRACLFPSMCTPGKIEQGNQKAYTSRQQRQTFSKILNFLDRNERVEWRFSQYCQNRINPQHHV